MASEGLPLVAATTRWTPTSSPGWPGFVQLEDAKDVALDSVVACLLKRGTEGQEVVEETAERVPVLDADGAVVGYEFVVTKRVTKRIVDTRAAHLVLASARPEFRSGHVEPPEPIRDPEESAVLDLHSDPVLYRAIAEALREARERGDAD